MSTNRPLLRVAVSNNYFLAILGYALILVVAAPSLLSGLETWGVFEHVIHNRIAALALVLAAYPATQLIAALLPSSTPLSYKSRNIKYSIVSLLGHVMTGFGFLHHDLILVILGRGLCGFSAEPINRSFISVKAASPILIGLAFVVGPAVTSLIADAAMLTYFQSALPFWLLAGLTLLQIVILSKVDYTEVPSSFQREPTLQHWLFWLNASLKHLRRVTFFVFMIAWYLFVHFLSAVLFSKFDWSEVKIGLVYSLIGLFFVVAYALRPMRKTILVLGFLFLSAIVLVFLANPIYFVACALLLAFFSSLTFRQIDWFFDGSSEAELDQLNVYLTPTTGLCTLIAIGIGSVLLSLT